MGLHFIKVPLRRVEAFTTLAIIFAWISLKDTNLISYSISNYLQYSEIDIKFKWPYLQIYVSSVHFYTKKIIYKQNGSNEKCFNLISDIWIVNPTQNSPQLLITHLLQFLIVRLVTFLSICCLLFLDSNITY